MAFTPVTDSKLVLQSMLRAILHLANLMPKPATNSSHWQRMATYSSSLAVGVAGGRIDAFDILPLSRAIVSFSFGA